MDDTLNLIAFESSVVNLCNDTPISSRAKYYVLKDITQKLLVASEQEYAEAMKQPITEKGDMKDAESTRSE